MTVTNLLLTILLQPDEGALAYLSRLAARNGVPSARSFCTDWALNFSRLVDGCPSELGRLAELSDVPVARLIAASIRKEGKAFHVRGDRMNASSLRLNRFHVCPACLKADIAGNQQLLPHAAAFGRLAWQVEGVRTCTTHGIALVDLGAGTGPTKHDFTGVTRPHLKRLDDLIVTSLRRAPSELERYVVCRLDGQACNATFLDSLDLYVAIRFCEVIGTLAVHGRGVHLKQGDEAELHLAGSVGIGIAGGGEHALQDFLTNLRREYPYGCRVRAGPRPPFTELQAWVNAHSHVEAYEPVRALLRRHLAQPVPVDIAEKPSVLTGSAAASKYAAIMNGRPRIIRDRLHQGTPDNHVMTNLSIADPAPRPTLALPLAETACRLACDLPLLLALVAHRILIPVFDGGVAGWRHAFSNDDVNDLLGRVMVGTTRVEEDAEGTVGLYEGADRLLRAPIEILRLVLGRCVAWVGRREGAHGVGSLLFRLDELRSLVDEHELSGPTMSEAAALLGRDTEQVGALIDRGAMTSEKGLYAETGIAIDVIPALSFDGFIAANIDLRLIARGMGSKPNTAMAFLSASGLQPTFADADLGVTYYRRADVAEIQSDLHINRPILWRSRPRKKPKN
ncbi:TniQ family protein [Methylobacterium sp. Leaf106]|uniref:TniQ family protein n=1 Tax=Methylobacterium sp. Leaf106 TaxID=1736255 RepID=UPI0006F6B9AF|nr:TniQ family protein [Methylobacterium sp. Leaf106]KQP52820.1 hypothetical protein ASF34_00040 [Methylobacterium sp. Leaf106]